MKVNMQIKSLHTRFKIQDLLTKKKKYITMCINLQIAKANRGRLNN